jgi:hypothetical protein
LGNAEVIQQQIHEFLHRSFVRGIVSNTLGLGPSKQSRRLELFKRLADSPDVDRAEIETMCLGQLARLVKLGSSDELLVLVVLQCWLLVMKLV